MEIKPHLLPKSAFIHIPKTGGTWVREHLKEAGWLTVVGNSHICAADIPPKYSRPFYFTFVRHPVDLIKSYWAWSAKWITGSPERVRHYIHWAKAASEAKADSHTHWDLLMIMMGGLWCTDLNVYVKRVLDYCPDVVDKDYRYYCTGLQFIGKTENITEDLIQALRMAGEEFDLDVIRTWQDKRNESDYFGWELDPSLAKEIMKSNPWTVQQFGYE